MKSISRRDVVVSTLALASSTLILGHAKAQEYNPDGRYTRIKPARVLEQSDKVEVVDVFWYGCSHCYKFLPYIESWSESLPEYAVLHRLPAVFGDSWVPHARAYFTAKVLGVADQMHVLIFNAIHEEKRPLNTKEELMEFFAENGVSETEFSETYDSFTVDSLSRQAAVMPRRWGVQGTPSLIINGRYLVSGSLAGSYEDMIKVGEALVEREHEAMAERNLQNSS